MHIRLHFYRKTIKWILTSAFRWWNKRTFKFNNRFCIIILTLNFYVLKFRLCVRSHLFLPSIVVHNVSSNELSSIQVIWASLIRTVDKLIALLWRSFYLFNEYFNERSCSFRSVCQTQLVYFDRERHHRIEIVLTSQRSSQLLVTVHQLFAFSHNDTESWHLFWMLRSVIAAKLIIVSLGLFLHTELQRNSDIKLSRHWVRNLSREAI